MRSWGKFLVAILWLASRTAFSAETNEAATIDAAEMNFDKPNNMAYANGDVVIRYQGSTIRADKARYNSETKDVWAEGRARLYRDGQEWVAPVMQYNFDTKQLKTDYVRGFFDPLFLTADHVSMVGSNHYTAPRVTLTTCDQDVPDYHVKATHAEIYPGDRIEMANCTLWLGPVPVFWLPAVTYSLKGDYQPFSIALGQSSRWGFYALTRTTWQLNPSLEVAVRLDERTQRGLGSGADVKYRLGDAGQGLLRGYYLNDADARETADSSITNHSIQTSRWIGEWQHKQSLSGNITLTIDLNKQSDRAVVEDFFPNDYRTISEPDSIVDITKRGENYTVSALARPQLNNFYNEVERLPEAKWAVNRTRIGPTPFFYEGETSVGYYNNSDVSTNLPYFDPTYTGSTIRMDTFHQIVSPQMLFGWLSFVPHAGGRYTYYERAPSTASETNEVKRLVADLGGELSFKLTRTWPNIRHIVEPFANYQWIPTPNVKSNELFQFDTVRSVALGSGEQLVNSRYLPLDFPAYSEIDAIDRENTVRFGLRQRLQTRQDGRPWDLVELTGWTDFHIERDNGQRDFSNLFGTLEIRPSEWIALQSFARYDLRDGVLRELNNEVRVGNADRWTVGIGTRYLKDDSNLVSGSFTCRLGARWVVQGYERVDMQDGQWEEHEYLLRQETHDWFITYGVRYRSQRTREDDKTAYIAVTLKAFPGVKLAANGVDLGSGY